MRSLKNELSPSNFICQRYFARVDDKFETNLLTNAFEQMKFVNRHSLDK